MLSRWFFLIFGQGGQCKLHWPQNLAAMPQYGTGLASQRGVGSYQISGPCPPRATGGRPPWSGALPAGRRPPVARPMGLRRLDPPPAGVGGRVGPESAYGGAGPGQARPGPPRPGQARPIPVLWARAWGVGRPPRPCGGGLPPTAVGLRRRSSVNVVGVHNLVIMAPILGSWHMISHDPNLNFDN
jgi:hypothetical protein